MRTIVLFSALSLALSAPTLLQAQMLTPAAPLSHAASLQPLSEAFAAAATPQPLSSVFASLSEAAPPVDPRVAAEFAAIFAAPCTPHTSLHGSPDVDSGDGDREPCVEASNPYSRFLDSAEPLPLTPEQKAHLAFHNLKDPGNLATITYTAGFTIATNSHTAYGPGWGGFGKNIGYSLLQDATGEFFGTFLVPSLTHEDPHYHRMPNASIPRRIVHAISRTVIAQSDTGAPMLNFATLLGYPIGAEIGNLYVPGINPNGPSTVARIMTGYATDPIDNLITEFLPDIARHIHVRVIFAQRIVNQVSSDQYSLP